MSEFRKKPLLISPDQWDQWSSNREIELVIPNPNSMTQLYLSFDVESWGLHGEGFAYGYVVVNESGTELEQGYAACYGKGKYTTSLGHLAEEEDYSWVQSNVIPALSGSNCSNSREVRFSFWSQWLKWKKNSALMIADCPFPVETNFLSSCIRDCYPDSKWENPYPLISIDSVMLSAGMNPIGDYDRFPNELPKHHPTCDARQSARLFLEAMQKTGAIAP